MRDAVVGSVSTANRAPCRGGKGRGSCDVAGSDIILADYPDGPVEVQTSAQARA